MSVSRSPTNVKTSQLPNISTYPLALGRQRGYKHAERFRVLLLLHLSTPENRMHYVESGQIASLSCWLAAPAPTGAPPATRRTLRPECQAGFRSHLRSCYK